MKIPKKFELHLVAGADQGTMQYDAVRIEDGALVATDGIVAARIPIGNGGVRAEAGEELVNGAAINPRAWAEAVRGTQGEGTLRLAFDAQTAVASDRKPTMVFFPPEGGADVERPPIGEFLGLAVDVSIGNHVCIGLNTEALHRLARALGTADVELHFQIDGLSMRALSQPVLVRAADSRAYGAIMPIVGEDA